MDIAGEATGRCRSGADAQWHAVVDRYSSDVWAAIRREGLPERLAGETSRLTWMQLADRFNEIDPAQIRTWLRETARRESVRSARLAGVAPAGSA
jgi:hypothetical protein